MTPTCLLRAPTLVGLAAPLLAGLFVAGPAAAQGGFAPAEDATPTDGVRRAFVVGVEAYQDAAFAPLRFAGADARAFGEVLGDPRYGGFASVEVIASGTVTAQAVLERLEAWSRTLGPEDFGLVYFSGHGTRWIDERNRSQVFLATSDTARANPLGTAIPMQALQERVATLPSRRKALVIDACMTGDGKVDSADTQAAARSLVDEKAPFTERYSEKEAQLFATTYGKPALESAELGHGVYTYHFLQALSERFSEADVNEDLVVTVSEAHDFARDRTMSSTGSAQVPMAYYKVIGREELILSGDPRSRRRVEAALVAAYSGPQEGIAMIIDGEERGAFPRSVLVDPGSHVVEFRTASGRVIDRGRFTFRKEQAYDASRIRDSLNGGRHLLSFGGGVVLFPGEAHIGARLPVGVGGKLGYTFRFPGKDPLARRFGLALDATVAGFGSVVADVEAGGYVRPDNGEPAASPSTLFVDLGFGPLIRLDIPYVILSIQPRFGVGVLTRLAATEGFAEGDDSPYVNWVFGFIGGTASVGVRPTNRFSIQAQWTPMGTNVPFRGGKEAQIGIHQRVLLVAEVGL
jgi:hypothetical protein